MKKQSKRLSAIATLLLLVLVLTACGTGEPSSMAPADSQSDSVANAGAGTDYPAKSITVIVPYAAGGEHDMVARAVAAQMRNFGYTFVIQNTSGASVAAMEYIRSNTDDGYTLFMHSPEVMAASYVSGSLQEPLHEEYVYLGNFVFDPGVIAVAKDSPYNTLQDLLDAAAADPGGVRWASVGASGKNAYDAQNFFNTAGLEFNYIPYEDAAKSRAAVMGGHAEVYHAYCSGAKLSVDAGELKVLAVAAPERVSYWPDIPTLRECGMELEFGLTRCWDIHPNAPQEIADKLTADLKACMESGEMRKILDDMGANVMWMEPEAMRQYGVDQFEIYRQIHQQMEIS